MSNKVYRLVTISLSLIVCLISYELYIRLASPQVPYMDTMLFFVQIDQILRGEISWLGVYGSGEHRGIIYPFITFIEWGLWGVNAKISTALTGVVVASTFYFWLKALLNAQAEFSRLPKINHVLMVGFCFVSAVIIVSPAAFELWTLDLGFAQLIKNFIIVSFLYLLAVKQCWSKNIVSAIIVGVCGGLLILLATYGWSYAFVVACLVALALSALNAPNLKWHAGIVAILMLLAQMIYIYSGHGVFDSTKTESIAHPSIINLIKGVLYGASTALMGQETMVKISLPISISLLMGVLILIVALLSFLMALFELTREKIFLSSLLIFSLTVLAGVTVARGATEFSNTGASRYFVDFVWLLLAPLAIVITTDSINVRPIMNRFAHLLPLGKLVFIARAFAVLLFIAALLGHSVTWYKELKAAPYRAVIFNNMADVYRKGVSSEEDAALLQSPFSTAKKAIVVAQTYNLAVLRHDVIGCTLKDAEFSADWYSAEANNYRWMGRQGVLRLGKCATTVTLKGYLPEGFNQRNLTISYGNENHVIAIAPGKEFSFTLNQLKTGRSVITLNVDQTTSPYKSGLGVDQRELGLLLNRIGD